MKSSLKLNQIKISHFTNTGNYRTQNEDTYVCDDLNFSLHGNQYESKLLCIFDGHGGTKCSKYLENNFVTILKEHTTNFDDIRDAVEQSCSVINKKFLDKFPDSYEGSCAIIGLIIQNISTEKIDLLTANIGDSRGLIALNSGSGSFEVVTLSKDHKPDLPSEKKYIESHGGTIIDGRLNGSLAVSRAFGNRDLIGKGLRSTPEFIEYPIDTSIPFVIYASDGVWDVVDNQEAIDFVAERLDEKNVAESLVNYALAKGSTDNVTVIVASLSNSK